MKYKFEIGAYTPETIPMARLAEYMADLAKLLGEKHSVHLSEVESGSTIPVMVIDREAVPKVQARLISCGTSTALADVASAYESLDRKLAEDNASGRLYSVDSDGKEKSNVIQFPGVERVKPLDYGMVKEHTSIHGKIVGLVGADNTAHIRLQTGSQILTGIEVNQDIARKLAPHWGGVTVRLFGEGRWAKENGAWTLKKMRVSGYEILNDSPLSESVTELRAVPGSGWKAVEDPSQFLRDLRDDGGKAH